MKIIQNIHFEGEFHAVQISPSSQLNIGSDVTFKNFTSLEVGDGAELILGNRVFFNDHCTLRCHTKIEIGKETMFGDGVRLFDHNHQYSNYHVEKIAFTDGPITIGKNCWIGANATILKGVTIGDNVIIGANCLITRDVPSHSIVTQNPDFNIRTRPQKDYHVLTVTASDTLENLQYLAENLPQVEFHIAAKTSVSPFLESFKNYPNITLYTNVHHEDIFDDLIEKANIYLDINHWGSVDNILEKVLQKEKPIFAFDNVAHIQATEGQIFSHQEPEKLLIALKECLSLK